MYLVPRKQDFIPGHVLQNLTKGCRYKVMDRYCKSMKIVDDVGNDVWVSNTLLKRYFIKEE